MGLWVLASHSSASDCAILLQVLKATLEKQSFSVTELEEYALLRAIDALEAKAPQEMAALASTLLEIVGRSIGDADAALAARTLVLLVRLGNQELSIITPFIERLRKEPSHRIVRRWTQRMARIVRTYEPESSQAQVYMRLLRVLALEKTVESGLIRQITRRTPSQVRQAWRWLQKSDRVIETVADAEWRKHFNKSKAHLEQKVRRSRKLVHIQARAGDWE